LRFTAITYVVLPREGSPPVGDRPVLITAAATELNSSSVDYVTVEGNPPVVFVIASFVHSTGAF